MNTDDRQQHIDEPLIQWCHCEEGPYLGAQKIGTPPRCERCGFLPNLEWVHDALTAALHAHADRARVLAAHADAGWLDEEEQRTDTTGGWLVRRYVSEWEPTP